MKFLIVRLGSLGDIIHALPVAAALRDRHSDAQIDWLVDARYRAILDYVPAVNRRVVVNARPSVRQAGLSGSGTATFGGGAGWAAAVRELRRVSYDVALDLQGLLKSAVLARLSGSARVVGFAPPHLRERGARFFYTETIDPGAARHVIDKNLASLAAIGIAGAARRFPLDVAPSPIVADLRARLGLPGDGAFVLINPGGAWPNKRWPADRFAAAASAIRVRHGLRSAVLWGPGEETLARDVAAGSNGAAIVAPPTTVADLVRLARASRLVISGDTGPLHIAAASGAPIVALFGPTDPQRNGPWDPSDITLSRYDACVCHYRRRCRRRTDCLGDVSVEDVVAAIDRRLAATLQRT